MKVIYKGKTLTTSLLPLSYGETFEYDGVLYIVVAIDCYDSPTAIVRKVEK